MFCGFLLVWGAIAVLTNVYWNICFYFNLLIFVYILLCDAYAQENLLERTTVQSNSHGSNSNSEGNFNNDREELLDMERGSEVDEATLLVYDWGQLHGR